MRLVVNRCLRHKNGRWRCEFVKLDDGGRVIGSIESFLSPNSGANNASEAIEAILNRIRRNAWEWEGKPRYIEIQEVKGKAYEVTEDEVRDVGSHQIKPENSQGGTR